METRSNHVLVGGVVLVLLSAMVAFIIWIAGAGGGLRKEYDIFFKQSVEGLNPGSKVTFSGVPSGEVRSISVWKRNPEFIRVRIAVNNDLPVLIGTTASISGVGFTGVSQVTLSGAVKGAPPISDPGPEDDRVPVIPTRSAGLGALLNNAPQLIERLSTLTERLTEVLNDRNQKAFSNILANVDTATGDVARAGPELRVAMVELQGTIRRIGDSADKIGNAAGSADTLLAKDGTALFADLRKTANQAEKSLANLDAAVNDTRPGLQALSSQTVPEMGQLVRDLRQLSESLNAIVSRVDQEGATSLLLPPTLPDYKPQRKK